MKLGPVENCKGCAKRRREMRRAANAAVAPVMSAAEKLKTGWERLDSKQRFSVWKDWYNRQIK